MSRPPIRIAVLFFCHETCPSYPMIPLVRISSRPSCPPPATHCLCGTRRLFGGLRAGRAGARRRKLSGHRVPLLAAHRYGLGLDHDRCLRAFRRSYDRWAAGAGAVRRRLFGAARRNGREGHSPPGGRAARRVRAAVGRGCRIAGTFDLHGNEDAAFLEQADFAFAVKYFPHYYPHLQCERAARMLIRAIRGDYAPLMRCARCRSYRPP